MLRESCKALARVSSRTMMLRNIAQYWIQLCGFCLRQHLLVWLRWSQAFPALLTMDFTVQLTCTSRGTLGSARASGREYAG
nr:hypothetical protein Iba_chr14dCG8910 [Ipomoea batatas]